MKPKKITHKIPLYGGKFTIVATDKITDAAEDDDMWTDDWDAVTTWGDPMNIKVVFSKNVTPGIIAHECKHAVNAKFKFIGLKLDSDNDEAECYLLGWMVNRVHDFLRKHKIKIK